MRSRIMVTGGAGYIGSHTAHELVARGYGVVVFDNLQQGKRAAVPADAVFIEGDLRDPAAVQAAFAAYRYDAIIHFASNTLVGESMRKPLLYVGDNVEAALTLVRAAVEHRVPRFIFSSTANLFGDAAHQPISEETPIAPASPYGESKHMVERILLWAEQVYGIRTVSLRYFNAAGADPVRPIGEDHDPETHIVPIVLDAALRRRPYVEIFGDDYPTPDGTCVRDFIHVCDLADAHIRVLDAPPGTSRCYNLGTGQGCSVRELIRVAERVTGRSIPVRIGPRRRGDPAVLVASSECIRRDLGWEPQHSAIETIVSTAWAWHTRHVRSYAAAESPSWS